jgi:SWI/SNF-related matrix-associated actin-dependent regulator of chromatin subfamily A3
MPNRVFIVEPQWNPSVENQAVARALRLGQKQTVLVTRYVVEQTVEQVRWHDLDCSSSLT